MNRKTRSVGQQRDGVRGSWSAARISRFRGLAFLMIALAGVQGLWFCAPAAAAGNEKKIELSLQRRDAKTGEIQVKSVEVAPSECAIVVVDMWQYHWCATWCGRAGAMIPRMNRAFDVARKLGMTVVFAPTECADVFSGTPQRETMAGLPYHKLPERIPIDFPDIPVGGDCMCGGPFPCIPHFGHYGQDSRLVVADNDLVSSGAQEMYNFCQERGIKYLIYTGGATNACLIYKPEAMVAMTSLGVQCVLARDINEALTRNSGSESSDENTVVCVDHIEKYLAPSIDLVGTFRKAGAWNDEWVVDPVLIAPWGLEKWPKLFDNTLQISLSLPSVRVAGAEIHYTTDGSEPGLTSPVYTKPFQLTETAVVRAVAFKNGKKVSLESSGYYAKLLPWPPMPDVRISDLSALVLNMAGWNPNDRPNPGRGPGMGKSWAGSDLTIRGDEFQGNGMGLHAPCEMVYEIKPEYERFVAKVGIDNSCFFDGTQGRARAGYPTAVFKVFIDGKRMAESPVMTFGQEPWRFNVEIPKGSRVISLSTTDAGDGSREDIVIWGNAGFVLKK